MRYDALVVGGSFAGLSAAMQLARPRKNVCVVDAGAPRNRFAARRTAVALEGPAKDLTGVRLEDGRIVPVDALFMVPRTRPSSPIAEQLGCAFDDGPAGPVIRADALKMATVPGVFAAGDVAMPMHNATLSSADGVMAGTSMHRAMVFGA